MAKTQAAFVWAIEDIVAAHPDLYLEHCAVMATALMMRQSASPCEFIAECRGFLPHRVSSNRFRMRVSWSEETARNAVRLWRTEQPKPVVERAAIGLAALLFAKLMPDGRMRVTREGDRADYWLPSLKCALEVSGTEHAAEFARRCREKADQVLGNPLGWDGYSVVCCFAGPQSIIQWAYHRLEDRDGRALKI